MRFKDESGDPVSTREFIVKAAVHIAGNPTWVFAIVVTMAVCSSLSSMFYLSGLKDDLGGVYEKEVGGQAYAQNAYAAALALESCAKDLVLAEDQAGRIAASESLRKQSSSLDRLVGKAVSTFNARKYRTLVSKTQTETDDLDSFVQGALASSSAPLGETEARKILDGVLARSDDLKPDLFKLYDVKRRSSRAWFNAVGIQLRASLLVTIVILAISVAVRVFLYQGQRRKMPRPPKSGRRGSPRDSRDPPSP